MFSLEKINLSKRLVVALLAVFTITACKDDEQPAQDNTLLFSEMQDALGGKLFPN